MMMPSLLFTFPSPYSQLFKTLCSFYSLPQIPYLFLFFHILLTSLHSSLFTPPSTHPTRFHADGLLWRQKPWWNAHLRQKVTHKSIVDLRGKSIVVLRLVIWDPEKNCCCVRGWGKAGSGLIKELSIQHINDSSFLVILTCSIKLF